MTVGFAGDIAAAIAQALTSPAFSRYEIPLAGSRDVLVAVSNSGNATPSRATMLRGRARAAARGVS